MLVTTAPPAHDPRQWMCLVCRAAFHATTPVAPRDMLACCHCGTALVVLPRQQLRLAQPYELAALPADDLAYLRALQQAWDVRLHEEAIRSSAQASGAPANPSFRSSVRPS